MGNDVTSSYMGGVADTLDATSIQMAAQNEVTSSKGRAVLTTMLGRK